MPKKKMSFQELTALVQRADLRQNGGDILGALQDYERALKEAPDDPMIWNNRGVSFSSLGRYDDAIGSYRKALEKRPGYWNAWFNLGKALQKKADGMAPPPEQAGKAGQQGAPAVMSPERAEVYEEALMAYDRALEIDPAHNSTLNNKAVALRKLHRYEEALETYDHQLGIDPMYPYAWYNKGTLLKLMGLPKEADRCFEVAAGLGPEFAGLAGRKAKGGKAPPRKSREREKGAMPPSDGAGEDQIDLRDVERPHRTKREEEKP